MIAVEPGPAANAAVVIEKHPVESLVVVATEIVENVLILYSMSDRAKTNEAARGSACRNSSNRDSSKLVCPVFD